MSFEPAISIKNLSKCYQLYAQPQDRLKQFLRGGRHQYYREFWALHDVSLDIMPGEVLGIVGRNGAGKSTLLQLLCNTLNPTSGCVDVRGRISALLELGSGFNPEFSGRENVYLSASILGLSKQEIDARFEEIVDFSGIRDFLDQPVKTYSSGMYVRLAFSVATTVDPDILVVDEALSVGDGEFARKSFERIRGMKEAGKTILFCSHSLYQMEAFCDRVLWLDHGKLMLLGEPQEVVRRYSDFLLGNIGETKAESAMPITSRPPSPQGYARLSHIEVSLDGIADRMLHGRPGENNLSIRLQFESDPELPAPTVGATIDYGTLVTVACVVSGFENISIERDEHGRGEVTIDFPNLPLRKGEYQVSVYLASEDAIHIYDNAQKVATIKIEDTLPSPGLVNLPCQWRTSAGHNSSPIPTLPPKDAGWQLTKLFTGRQFWVDRADSLEIVTTGIFEPVETALLQAIIRPGDRILDIGANMGYYTALFADWVGPSGIVHAVEPDPDNFALLNANTLDFQKDGRVHLHALALSEAAGTAKLFRSKDNVGMHRLYDSICCDGSFMEVTVCRGDDMALTPLDFIKIDIEGYEAVALRGLSDTLTDSPNVKILCEFCPISMMEAGIQPVKWIEWLENHGFIAIAYNGTAWSPVMHEDLKQELNCLTELDFIGLTSELRAHNNASIADAAVEASAACGYSRPILENLLLVRQQTLQALIDKGIVFNLAH
ncbi:MAG: FkbM family methyltransferase [Methylobacter sp.]